MTINGNEEPGTGQAESEAAPESSRQRRVRSTIEFPYHNLEDSITIARAVHQIGGHACEWSQVAAKLDQSPKGGAFRNKMLAARTYGLLEYKGQDVELTALGRRAIDPVAEKGAKVDAFLNVPLFAQAFEQFRDHQLPPPAAIQQAMVTMGVAPKQADRARQVFIRSARFAGFFELAADRLVKPNVNGPATAVVGESLEADQGTAGSGEPPEPPQLHPFIEGLLRELPEPESEWRLDRRVKWLRTAANIFDMIYEEEEGVAGEIAISVGGQAPASVDASPGGAAR